MVWGFFLQEEGNDLKILSKVVLFSHMTFLTERLVLKVACLL